MRYSDYISAHPSSQALACLSEQGVRMFNDAASKRLFPRDVVTLKLMQISSSFGLLAGVDLQGRDRVHIVFLGKTVDVLTAMMSTSAACVHATLKANERICRHEDVFGSKDRVVAVDSHPSNFCVERRIRRERRDWRSLVVPCEIHQLAITHATCFDPLESIVSGVLRMSLSLLTGGGVAEFRSCLVEIALQRILVIVGNPPAACVAYRRAALRWFIPGGGSASVRRALLDLLPQGNWKRRDVVEVYAGVGDVDELGLRVRAARGLAEALAHRVFRVYRRGRWTGREEALCDVGILDVCCGLLTPTYQMWVEKRRRKRRRSVGHADAGRGGLVDLVPCGDSDGEHDALVASLGEDDHSESFVREGQLVTDGAQAKDIAEENEANRQAALRWLATSGPSPDTQLILLRTVIAPLQSMLRALLAISAESWEVRQRAQLLQGTNQAALGRDFRISIAARGDLEREALLKLSTLLVDSRLWCLVLPRDLTVKVRALAFLMITRAGANLLRRFVSPPLEVAVRVFLWLEERGFATALEQLPLCMFDKWGLNFRLANPILGSMDVVYKLATIACFAATSTASLEVNHAYIRRMLKQRVQTQQMGMEDLNAYWIGAQVRRGTDKAAQPIDATVPRVAPVRADAVARRGGGGQWRHFGS